MATDEVWDSWKGIPGWVEDSAQPRGNSQDRRGPRKITFGLADHDVAELALPSFIEALHLNVVGGLRLQVADGVPVPVPWEGEWGGHYGCLLPLTNTGGTGELPGDHPCFCFAMVVRKEAY